MIIAVATATGQNSAYRHRKYEGRFRKRRRPSLSIRPPMAVSLDFLRRSGSTFSTSASAVMPCFFAQDWNGAVLDELIGPTDPHHRRVDHLRVQMFHHRAAETVVQNVIFDRADDLDAAREKFERAGVHRLDPARIDERNGNSFSSSLRAASSATSNMLPKPKIATSRPCCTTSALPISRSFGSGLIFAPGPEPRG